MEIEQPGPEALVDAALDSDGVVDSASFEGDEWFWEGNVQATVVRELAGTGWSIRRVANTATSEHGVDIEAQRGGERLLVEVKGYPGSTYQRGERRGQAKATPAAAQARAYFSNGLLAALLMRADADDAKVVLAFPDVPTYRNLEGRVAAPLAAARIELWFVTEAGKVSPSPTS